MPRVAVEILEILCTINEAFWIFVLMEVLFDRRERFQKSRNFFCKYCILWGPVLLYFILVMALNQLTLTSPYTFIIAMLFSIVVVIVFWKSDLVLSIAIVGTYGLGLLVKDLIVMFVIGKIGGNSLIQKIAYEHGIERGCMLVIAGLSWFLSILLIYFWLKKKKRNVYGVCYLATICVTSYIGLLFFGTQILTNFVEELDIIMIMVMGIIAACVIVPYFIFKYKDMVNQLRIIEARNELLTKKYDTVSEYYTSNAKLYHDMKHHLNIVNYMLTDGESVEAQNYIQSLCKISEKYNKTIYTGIDIIDVILSDKEKQANDKEVEFMVQAQMLPQDIGIEKKDLCTIFANLLDNALEAVIEEIEVKIKISKRMLIIQVKNDFNVLPKKKNGYYQTTKKNSLYHGWGLRSVESIVEKYDGSMECKMENQFFTVSILINF